MTTPRYAGHPRSRGGWLLRLENGLAEALASDARRRARRLALRRALAEFEAHHNHWAHSGFDADLLAQRDGAAALETRDPSALARAWTQRFQYPNERHRERDVRRLEAVAWHLIELVVAEGVRLGLEAPPST